MARVAAVIANNRNGLGGEVSLFLPSRPSSTVVIASVVNVSSVPSLMIMIIVTSSCTAER